MIDIPCIIFAGGKSSRMGEDKALLPFGSFSTLTEFQLNKLQKIFKDVYISCKNKNKFDFQAKFIEDIKTENIYAPSIGFLSAFHSLKCEKFFAISVDTPFISRDIIHTLIGQDTIDTEVTVATLYNNPQPMCGVYHISLQEKFLGMLETDNHKLGCLLKNSITNYVNFENENSFLNLNNPDEYALALTLI
ncbi:MAG: molybdenum cofactor guanylyltransferase MobA [Helicobacteraceae bacterium]|nr:molybdenum cofactor guanylyltransferase MobA [Candidatus Sulfurimonas ponti]MBL6973751.1 molybdenum cofactor guanylyltransferase MobA [Sulfurimonas sp.]